MTSSGGPSTNAAPASPNAAPDCALGVFVRAPERGRVKTRLAAVVGEPAALALYEAFVRDTAQLCTACAPSFSLALWVTGAAPDPARGPLPRGEPWRRRVQRPGSLGERLAHALDTELQSCSRALVIGSDSPSLPAAYLHLCASALARAPLVLGPAVDGGFYLIGARRELVARLPELLGSVRWSTEHAFADTCAAARAMGIGLHALPPWFDVDDRAGLRLLRLQLALHPAAAAQSARCLAGLAFEPGF